MTDLTIYEFDHLSGDGLKHALRHEAHELRGIGVSKQATRIRVDHPFSLEKQAYRKGGLFFFLYCQLHRARRIVLNLLSHPLRYRESIIRAR